MNNFVPNNRLRIAVVVFLACLFAFAVWAGMRSAPRHLSDFSGYFTAASIVAHRDSLPEMYHDEWFKQQVQKLGLDDTGMVMYVNPPPVALVMVPLASLNPADARIVWNLLSIILVLLVFVRACKWFGITHLFREKVILFVLLACTLPFFRNLQRGQMYVFMLLFVLMLWRGMMTNNGWLTGLSLSVLLLLKYFGWMFLVLLLVQRRWRDIGITVFCFLLGTLATMIVVGPETYAAHYERLMSSFTSFDSATTRLPNIPAFFGELFVYHPEWNRHVIIDAPVLALVLSLTTLVVVLVVTLRNQTLSLSQKLFAILVLSVMFTPLAAEHHFIFLVLPLFFLIHDRAPDHPGSMVRIVGCIILGYSVLGWYPHPQSDILWLKMLDNVRLYGSAVVWVLFLRPRNSPAVQR